MLTMIENPANLNNGKKLENNHVLVPLATSVLIILFLFYIDEGFYNFKWMADLGSWVAFVIYFLGIFGGQIFISLLLFKNKNGFYRHFLVLFLGVPFGLMLTMMIFFGWRMQW